MKHIDFLEQELEISEKLTKQEFNADGYNYLSTLANMWDEKNGTAHDPTTLCALIPFYANFQNAPKTDWCKHFRNFFAGAGEHTEIKKLEELLAQVVEISGDQVTAQILLRLMIKTPLQSPFTHVTFEEVTNPDNYLPNGHFYRSKYMHKTFDYKMGIIAYRHSIIFFLLNEHNCYETQIWDKQINIMKSAKFTSVSHYQAVPIDKDKNKPYLLSEFFIFLKKYQPKVRKEKQNENYYIFNDNASSELILSRFPKYKIKFTNPN